MSVITLLNEKAKIGKKRLNKKFPLVRNRRYTRDNIKEVVGIFQNVESFMEI